MQSILWDNPYLPSPYKNTRKRSFLVKNRGDSVKNTRKHQKQKRRLRLCEYASPTDETKRVSVFDWVYIEALKSVKINLKSTQSRRVRLGEEASCLLVPKRVPRSIMIVRQESDLRHFEAFSRAPKRYDSFTEARRSRADHSGRSPRSLMIV